MPFRVSREVQAGCTPCFDANSPRVAAHGPNPTQMPPPSKRPPLFPPPRPLPFSPPSPCLPTQHKPQGYTDGRFILQQERGERRRGWEAIGLRQEDDEGDEEEGQLNRVPGRLHGGPRQEEVASSPPAAPTLLIRFSPPLRENWRRRGSSARRT